MPNGSPRKAEAVNDERCDRDRVTALVELERKVARGGMETDDFYEAHSELFQGGLWAIGRLLEALDAIDSLRSENELLRNRWNRRRELPALNGGNE